MSLISLSWSNFKAIVVNKAKVRIITRGADGSLFYYMTYADEGGVFESSVLQNSGLDQTDLETNYLPYANKGSEPLKDIDGAALSRSKQTAPGWTFQGHLFEFTPGKLGVFNKNYDNTDLNFVTLTFYELVTGVETLITGVNATNQAYLNANCIKTYADFEPTYDFDVIAGDMRFYTQVETDIHMWTVIAPDVSANLGGSKVLVMGRNLRHMLARVPHTVDGRVSKRLTYNATYHTSKIRFILRHGANAGVPIEMCLQFYKA